MTLSKYKITSPKLDGYILLTYHNSVIKSILFELKQPLKQSQWRFFLDCLSYNEGNVKALEAVHLTVRKLSNAPESKTNEKITKFCSYYMRYVKDAQDAGLKYNVSPKDSGQIKLVEVNDELLQTYFSSANFLFKNKYSIANYVRYHNELRAECYQSQSQRQSRLPNRWDPDFEKKLSGKDLTDYWAHLRECGLKPKKNHLNVTIDWIPIER